MVCFSEKKSEKGFLGGGGGVFAGKEEGSLVWQ